MAWRKPSNLNEWKAIFIRHQRVFIFPALAVMILVIIASFKVPREFRAEAKFERRSDLAMDTTGTAILKANLTPLRRKMGEDVKGRAAIEQLVDDLGLTRDMQHNADGTLTFKGQQERSDLVASYGSRLNVRWQTQSDQFDMVVVTFTAPERDAAPKVVNKLVENYLRRTRNELDSSLLNAKQFFDTQVDFYKARVQELETTRVRFLVTNPGLTPNDPMSVQNRSVEVRAQLQRVSQELDLRKAERAKKEELLQAMPDEIVKKETIQNPVLQDLIRRRGDLEKSLDDLLTGGRTEEHPTVKKTRALMRELDARIQATQQMIEGTSTAEPNVAKAQLKNEVETMGGTIQALTAQRDDLTLQADRFDFMVRNFESKRAEFVKLERDLEESHEQLKFWESKLNSTMIALKAELGSRGIHLNFLQRADIARPSKPQLLYVVGGALALGLMVGLSLVFLAEITDGSFRNVNQAIDELKLPVLGAVTQIMSPAEVMRRKVMSWAVLPALGGAMVLALAISLWCVYLSLDDTPKFDRLISNPPKFIVDSLAGRGG